MSKRMYDGSDDDADESNPELFRLLYAAINHHFNADDENAKKILGKG